MAGRHAARGPEGDDAGDARGAPDGRWWEDVTAGHSRDVRTWPLRDGTSDPSAVVASEQTPVVPGYVVERRLGAGGSGEVWRARPEGTAVDDGAAVALKVLRPGVAEDAAARRRLADEAALLTALADEHVVRLRAVLATASPPGRTVLVLDHAPGGTLGALVGRRGALDPGEVVTVLVPLAGVLDRLHAGGVAHGDVSPANVLFAGDGRPLLADLGTAGLVAAPPDGDGHDPGGAGVVETTVGYADPVRAAGGPATPEADVFALGACAWHALTGLPPGSPQARPPLVTLRPDLPITLVDLVEDCLEIDPAARPVAAEVARRAWDAEPAEAVRLVGTDPEAPPDEVVTHRVRAAARRAVPEETPLPRRRRPRAPAVVLTGALTVAAVALAALGLPLLLGSSPSSAEVPAATPVPTSTPAVPTPTASLVTPTATVTSSPAEIPGPPAPAPSSPTDPASSDAGVGTADEVVQADGAVPADGVLAHEEVLAGDDPVAAVPVLADLRARALAGREESLLARAVVPGSPAMASDEATLEELEVQEAYLEGLSVEVLSAARVGEEGEGTGAGHQTLVDVRTRTSAYRLVAADGDVLAEVPEGEAVAARLALVRGADGWQVAEVLPSAGA